MKVNQLTIGQRINATTPKFFKILRNISFTLGLIGGTIMAAPIVLPPIIKTIAGYLITAGTVAGCVSQTAVDEQELDTKK